MRARIFLGLLTTLMIVTEAPLLAQRRDDFFENGFSMQPGSPSGGGGGKSRPGKPAGASPSARSQGGVNPAAGPNVQAGAPERPAFSDPEFAAAEIESATAPSRPSADGEPGLEVLWVNAVINALDREHLIKACEELSSAIRDRRIKLGSIYLIGTPFKYTAADKEEFRERFNIVLSNFRQTVPEVYGKITRSPTWVVQTQNDGQIILEALPLA